MTRVYNGASMDLLHPGHLYALRQCRELAGPDGEVIVGLNTDDFIEQFKGHRPVQTYLERAEVLAACRYVDRVVPNLGGADSKPVLEAVMPDIIAVGPDWYDAHLPDPWARYHRQMDFDEAWLAEHNIRLHPLRMLPGRSSTNLRAIAGGIG